MTSMPASRSARAMIFAPRSWPSRPGFATTTRILWAPVGGTSVHGRFAVRAPDVLQRGDDLALARVGARAFEQRRHEVDMGARRALAQGPEAGGDRYSITPRAHPLQPIELLALKRRIDPQRRDRRVALGLEAVDPDHGALQRVDLGLQLVACVRDLALREVLLDGFDHPAELVDPAEVVV